MTKQLRILILEDRPTDAELMLYELRKAGYKVNEKIVETKKDFQAHLSTNPDVILADYTLPQFDAMQALRILQERDLNIPFLVITGSISEEVAVDCMKQGAADYLLKDRLARLGPAVEQALEAKRAREEHQQAELEREQYIRELKIINDTIVAASRMENVDDICQLIAETIHSVNPTAYIVVSLYDKEQGSIRPRAVVGLGDMAERIFNILGGDPKKMTADPNKMGEDGMLYTTGKLEYVPGGLYDLMAGALPRAACRTVETLMGVDNVYTVGFALGDEPYGGVSIFTRKGQDVHYKSAIETLTSHLSVVMQRRQAEESLRKSEQKYRLHFEHVSDIVYSIAPDFRILTISPSVQTVLGYRPEELTGKSFQDLNILAPDYLEAAVTDTLKVLKGERIDSSVYQFIAKDGTKLWGEVSGAPLIRNGEVVSVVSVARDITERKEMEEQLRQQERLAVVGQLAGGIAHDFRNFLTSIILHAQIVLGKADLSPTMMNSLEIIISEARRGATLVQQILDFSRRSMIDVETLDLISFIKEVTEILQQTIPENIQITLETSQPQESASLIIEADPTRIQQVLMNLATNARDAMLPQGGGELHIELSKVTVEQDDEVPSRVPAGEWVCLMVSDTGLGMSEEVQAHIFEPFFTTKEVGKGTGLGLAQVYGIVKHHDGFIDVETAQGEGTTFRIYLPPHEAEEATTKTEEEQIPEGNNEIILLVEDAERLRIAMRETLKSLGYRVLTAANGQEALEVSQSGQALDLVITDVVMPKMGGEQLLQALKEDHPTLPVVAVTGHVANVEAQTLEETGFAGVVTKPFQLERLAQVVYHAIQD